MRHLICQWHCDNAECKNKNKKCLMLKEKHHALNSKSLFEIRSLAMKKSSLKAFFFEFFTCLINFLLQPQSLLCSLLHCLLHSSHQSCSQHSFMFTWSRPHQCHQCHQCCRCSCRVFDSIHYCTCLLHLIYFYHYICCLISIHTSLHLFHNILHII